MSQLERDLEALQDHADAIAESAANALVQLAAGDPPAATLLAVRRHLGRAVVRGREVTRLLAGLEPIAGYAGKAANAEQERKERARR